MRSAGAWTAMDTREEAVRRVDELIVAFDEQVDDLRRFERPFLLLEDPVGIHGEEVVFHGTLDRPEELRAILHDRTAHRPTELVALRIRFGRLKDGLRIRFTIERRRGGE